jgi:acyl dehydratase
MTTATATTDLYASMLEHCGSELGISAPRVVTQRDVDEHARITGDTDYIHTDPERTKLEGLYPNTIVQGFLLLGLFTALMESIPAPWVGKTQFLLNYGFDRVRFVNPVLTGSSVRLHAKLIEVRQKDSGRVLVKLECQLWADGQTKVSVIADWFFMLVP